MGIDTYANGDGAVAMGIDSYANGEGAVAIGIRSKASGYGAVAMGTDTQAISADAVAFGMHNSPTKRIDDTDYYCIFSIGCGTLSSSENAFCIIQQSSTYNAYFKYNVYAANINSNNGADYAEYFEWSDGNPDNEDRIGHFVAIDSNGKIKIASSNTNVIGVISGFSSVIGNTASEEWHKKYVRDIYGR